MIINATILYLSALIVLFTVLMFVAMYVDNSIIQVSSSIGAICLFVASVIMFSTGVIA